MDEKEQIPAGIITMLLKGYVETIAFQRKIEVFAPVGAKSGLSAPLETLGAVLLVLSSYGAAGHSVRRLFHCRHFRP